MGKQLPTTGSIRRKFTGIKIDIVSMCKSLGINLPAQVFSMAACVYPYAAEIGIKAAFHKLFGAAGQSVANSFRGGKRVLKRCGTIGWTSTASLNRPGTAIAFSYTIIYRSLVMIITIVMVVCK